MRTIFLILFVLVGLSASAQNNSDRIFSIVTKETQSFIDSARKRAVKKGAYSVYVIHMYDTYPLANSICFDISYIENSHEYIYPSPPYMFALEDEIILVNNPKSIAKKWATDKKIELVDSFRLVRIKNKLAHDGVYINRCDDIDRLLVWYDGNHVKRRYCGTSLGKPSDIRKMHYCCTFDDFAAVKKSFQNDTAQTGPAKMKYRYLRK
jgi:hypothetical protein